MYAFKVKDQWLMLYPGSGTQLELQHPLVATRFEEPWSLPVEVPVEGNEVVLGHVHALPLAVRRLRIDEVELWRDGLFKHKGVFTVESSSEESITLTFSVDGFLTGLRDKRLRDVDFGPDIPLTGAGYLVADAAYRNTQAWPDARYCYPMIRNKDAYSNNPDWWIEGTKYDPAVSYSPTSGPDGGPSFIQYTPDTKVRRERIYTCIGVAPAGENPDNTPGDWLMRGQGLINPWSPSGGAWLQNVAKVLGNPSTGNRAAMSPQFYLKDILIRAMAAEGYTALGDFIDDTRSHQVIIYNNHLLDGVEREGYMLATLTSDQVFPSGTSKEVRYFKPDDESTPPNEDTAGVYDPVTGYITCATADAYTVRARVKTTFTTPLRCAVQVRRVLDNAVVLQGVSGANGSDVRTIWDFTFNGTFVVDIGYEGDYYVLVFPAVNGAPMQTISADSYLEVCRGSGVLVNSYATAIHPADHVPDITVSKLLDEVRKLFHLRITPDVVTKTIRFDFQLDQLFTPIVRDITEELRGPITLDHTQRTFGVRLKNARGRPDQLPDLSGHSDAPQGVNAFGVNTELDMDPAPADNLKLRVYNTGQMYVSRLFAANQYAWFPLGAYQPDAETGDMDGALEVAPEFGAPDMDLMPAPDGSECLMPVIDEPCSSAMFGQGKNAPSLLLMWYHGMQANAAGTYPLASPYATNHFGDPLASYCLTYQPEANSLYSYLWKAWLDRLVKAEVWQCDLDVGRLLTRNGVQLGRFLCKHQEVIIHTVPLEYDDSDGLPLIAPAARLLKLPRELGALARDGSSTDIRYAPGG